MTIDCPICGRPIELPEMTTEQIQCWFCDSLLSTTDGKTWGVRSHA